MNLNELNEFELRVEVEIEEDLHSGFLVFEGATVDWNGDSDGRRSFDSGRRRVGRSRLDTVRRRRSGCRLPGW